MQNTPEPSISTACFLSMLAPIFLINLIVPIINEHHPMLLDSALQNYLIENIGFWSSTLPLSSRITTNYIAVFAPIFSLMFLYRCLKISDQIFERANKLSLIKYSLSLIALLLFCSIFTYEAYLNSTDLMSRDSKLRIMGQNFLFYSTYSSGVFLFVFLLPPILFQLLFYVSYRIIMHFRKQPSELKKDSRQHPQELPRRKKGKQPH